MTGAFLKITDITVITDHLGMAKIYLQTELPEAVWPYKDKFCVTGYISSGVQAEWLAEHFPGTPVKFIKG